MLGYARCRAPELTDVDSRILKICVLIPLYTVLSFVTVVAPDSYVYLTPWIDVYQAIALGSFFLLLCEYVSPSLESRDVFFAAMSVPLKGKKQGQSISGLEFYRVCSQSACPLRRAQWVKELTLHKKKWFAIFQYPIVATGVAVIQDVTQAANVFCLENSSIHFAHLWVSKRLGLAVLHGMPEPLARLTHGDSVPSRGTFLYSLPSCPRSNSTLFSRRI